MPLIPYRPATPFTLTNVANNQALNVAAINGVTNAMKHLKERGRLGLTMAGLRYNNRVVPAIGDYWQSSRTVRLSRKAICAPIDISFSDSWYQLFISYNLRVHAIDTTTSPSTLIGSQFVVSLVQDGQEYELATVSFLDFIIGPNPTTSRFYTGRLPNKINLDIDGSTTCYIKVYFDQTASYQNNSLLNIYTFRGYRNDYLDYQSNINPTPNPPAYTFFDGLMNLTFSTFSDCNPC